MFFRARRFERDAVPYNECTFSSSENPFATRKKEATLMSRNPAARRRPWRTLPSSALRVFEFKKNLVPGKRLWAKPGFASGPFPRADHFASSLSSTRASFGPLKQHLD